MSWKNLLFLPLAALAVGIPLRAPRLRPLLEPLKSEACGQALDTYLLAHAYSVENPQVARRLIGSALRWLVDCHGEKAQKDQLERRIRSFPVSFP